MEQKWKKRNKDEKGIEEKRFKGENKESKKK